LQKVASEISIDLCQIRVAVDKWASFPLTPWPRTPLIAFTYGRIEGMESRPVCAAMTMGVYAQEMVESARVAVGALDKMLFEKTPAGSGRAN
jgi:hypothetical protein